MRARRRPAPILAERVGRIDVETLVALTRYHEGDELAVCAHARPDYDVESSGACIMSPCDGPTVGAVGQSLPKRV